MKKILLSGFMLLFAVVSSAATNETPYQGQQMRTIKSLSQKDIDGYLNGKGMGFAKAAELNHYPGPRHVLDLTKELSLSKSQQARTQKLFESMKVAAMQVGKQLVMQERELDELFAMGKINPFKLDNSLQKIGELTAKLRYVHLSTHLQQKEILTHQQVKLYDSLRGYSNGGHGQHNHSHGH